MVPYQSQAQRRFMHAAHPAIAKRWDKEFPNQKGLPERKKKAKISVNNKLKGTYGQMDPKTNKVEINVRAHKKHGKLDTAELASTMKHELLHVKHPKMTEKEVYSKSAKTKIGPEEKAKLLVRLRGARITKKVNSLRKKYKVDGSEPGAIYKKANELSKEGLAIRGLV